MLRLMIAGACLAAAIVTTTEASGGREVAEAPGQVRPLLIGAEVPDLILQSSEGEPVDLGRAIAAKPTILIIYRGGW